MGNSRDNQLHKLSDDQNGRCHQNHRRAAGGHHGGSPPQPAIPERSNPVSPPLPTPKACHVSGAAAAHFSSPTHGQYPLQAECLTCSHSSLQRHRAPPAQTPFTRELYQLRERRFQSAVGPHGAARISVWGEGVQDTWRKSIARPANGVPGAKTRGAFIPVSPAQAKATVERAVYPGAPHVFLRPTSFSCDVFVSYVKKTLRKRRKKTCRA